MDKPKGIKVIAILILIFSSLALISGIRSILSLTFPGSDVTTAFNLLGYSSSYLTYLLIETVILLIFNILFIIGAIGLLKYKKWGRKMVIFIAIGFLLESIFNLIYSSASGVSLLSTLFTAFSIIIGIILYGLVIFYLNKKKVKEAFE